MKGHKDYEYRKQKFARAKCHWMCPKVALDASKAKYPWTPSMLVVVASDAEFPKLGANLLFD